MENEFMISYGPEDIDRFERFTKLGFNIKRISGILYHLDHHIGVNSSDQNKSFLNSIKVCTRF